MIKKYLIFSDSHLSANEEPNSSYSLFKEVCKKVRPNIIVCLGDLINFEYIGKFSDIGSAEGCRIKDDIELFRNEFKFFKKCVKDEVIFLSGNHEDRLSRLFNSQPVLKGIVSIETVCEELGVKYIPTEEQPYKLLEDLYVTHGICTNKNFTQKMATEVSENIISGHCHRTQSYVLSYPSGRIVKSFGIGSLTEYTESYCKGKRVTGHSNSVAELFLDEESGYWQLNTIMIENQKCIVNGKLYTLETPSI